MSRLKPTDLPRALARELKSAYWICGDEPFLLEETKTLIRERAISAGFHEQITFNTLGAEPLSLALTHCSCPSLFSVRECLSLNLTTGKLNKAMIDDLTTLVQHLTTDQILIITSPKLDAALQKTTGFKALEDRLALIPVWPVTSDQLPQFLQQQATRHGLQIDKNLLPLLTRYFEGNLLAAKQFMWRLSLQQQGPLSQEQLLAELSDSARFDVFDLSQQCLTGQVAAIEHLIARLQEQAIDPILILWALTRDVRLCLQLHTQLAGADREQLFQANKIWDNLRPLYVRAYQRHPFATWATLLQQAFAIELAIKGLAPANLWRELTTLALLIAGMNSKVLLGS